MTRDTINMDEMEETRSLDLVAGRRAFIENLGVGAVGAAVFGAAAGAATSADAQAVGVNDVLNFALNLEYLEATFYNFAFTGADLSVDIVGPGSGPITGGRAVPFRNPLVKAYAQEIATEEKKHVQVLRGVLGSAAVPRPALNVGSAFAAAAQAAGIGPGFNAYANDTNFLLASYIFEDVGVTAYHGAARLVQSNKTVLNYAAGILAVEAYHAAIIRTTLFAMQNPTIVQDTALISNLRSKLANGRAGVDDVGIGVPNRPTLVPVDANALAFTRSAKPQVLNIVYGNQNTTPGLFFPAGMNGTIR